MRSAEQYSNPCLSSSPCFPQRPSCAMAFCAMSSGTKSGSLALTVRGCTKSRAIDFKGWAVAICMSDWLTSLPDWQPCSKTDVAKNVSDKIEDLYILEKSLVWFERLPVHAKTWVKFNSNSGHNSASVLCVCKMGGHKETLYGWVVHSIE